ncbi:DsbA family protein [Paenibacillus terreus]|uniref:DsbA family protein n=1 Tax=Paenibacillus terreus TaxID=1387834 RepID=A0ABV5B7L3_9BACL
MKRKKGFNAVWWCAALVILLLVLTGLTWYGKQASGIEDLPNYTDVKGKITVDGFKDEKQPFIGQPDAPVKVIEFGDFKCPACKQWHATVYPQFKEEFVDTGKVQFYFMNYAFLDRDSILAGSAGEAIYRQNPEAFWDYYSELYENQQSESKIWATHEFLIDFVKKNITGIDYQQFEADLRGNTYLADVKEDYKIGGYYGVNGTPAFFVNGKILRSMDYEELKAAINRELLSAPEL